MPAQSSRILGRSNVVIEAKGKGKFVIQAVTFRVMPREVFWKTLPSCREGNRLKVRAEFGLGIPITLEEEGTAQIKLKINWSC